MNGPEVATTPRKPIRIGGYSPIQEQIDTVRSFWDFQKKDAVAAQRVANGLRNIRLLDGIGLSAFPFLPAVGQHTEAIKKLTQGLRDKISRQVSTQDMSLKRPSETSGILRAINTKQGSDILVVLSKVVLSKTGQPPKLPKKSKGITPFWLGLFETLSILQTNPELLKKMHDSFIDCKGDCLENHEAQTPCVKVTENGDLRIGSRNPTHNHRTLCAFIGFMI